MEHTSEDCQCEGKACSKCEHLLCLGHYAKQMTVKSGLRSACRGCLNKQGAKWREENVEYNRQRVRDYHQNNLEQTRQKNKEWREKNAEYDKERHKRYHQENAEKIREYGKEYRAKNRPVIRDRERIYWEKNKEKHREKSRRYSERHKAEIAERRREYRRNNLEKVRARERLYGQMRAEQRRLYGILWRQRQRGDRPKMKPGPKPKPKPVPKLKVRQLKLPFRYKKRTVNIEARRARWKKHYHKDPTYHISRSAQWIKDNPRRHAARQAKRRTLKTQAGGSYTAAEFESLCEAYNNTCLRCGRSDVKLTADHIMPISMGGSSDISNIQPLCFSCNSSKGAKFIDFRPKTP